MLDEHQMCSCGHHKKYHEDTDVFSGWGEGKCTRGLCQCKNFDCAYCLKQQLEDLKPMDDKPIIEVKNES